MFEKLQTLGQNVKHEVKVYLGVRIQGLLRDDRIRRYLSKQGDFLPVGLRRKT